jgi:hypothetical protein
VATKEHVANFITTIFLIVASIIFIIKMWL